MIGFISCSTLLFTSSSSTLLFIYFVGFSKVLSWFFTVLQHEYYLFQWWLFIVLCIFDWWDFMFLGLIGDTILTGGKWYFWLGTLCSSDWLVMLIFDWWDFMFLGLIGDAISTGGTDIFDWWDFMFLGLIGDANIGKISCPCHFMISGRSPWIFSETLENFYETLKNFYVCAINTHWAEPLHFFWKIGKISMSVPLSLKNKCPTLPYFDYFY